jgi:hypothetical protein
MKRHSKIFITVISIVIFLYLLSSCNENNATTSPSNTLSSNSLETTSNSSAPVSSSTSSSSISSTVIEEIKHDKTIIENKAVIDLDGDGKKENIDVKHIKDNDYAIEIYINNEKMIDASDFKDNGLDVYNVIQMWLIDYDSKDGKIDIGCAIESEGDFAPEYLFTYYNGEVYRTENVLAFAGDYGTDYEYKKVNILRDEDGNLLTVPVFLNDYWYLHYQPVKVQRLKEKLIVNLISKDLYRSPLNNKILNLKTDVNRKLYLEGITLPISVYAEINSKKVIEQITETSEITVVNKFSKKGYLQIICNGKEGWLDVKDEKVDQFIYICFFVF